MGDKWRVILCVGSFITSPEHPDRYNGLIPLFRVSDFTDELKFYRKCADTHTYFSTEKAGEVLLPVGSDGGAVLNLTSVETLDNPMYFDTNAYAYEFAGTTTIKKPGMVVDRKISNEDFHAYPKDGIVVEDGVEYWYKYLGTNELLDFIWPDYSLRSVPDYNIDINTPNDLLIGDVAGASFRVQVQGTVKELIKYLGRKCELSYDFKNQGKYTSYGVFTIADVSYINHSVSQIVAYDNIKKFDKPVLDYITTLTYPMTAKQLWHIMCEYCEVPYYQQDEFLNSDALIYGPFGDNNLTARTVVGYIAQIAGGYIVCDRKGYAVIRNLMPVRTTLYNGRNVYNDNSYLTFYKNLPPFRTYQSEIDGATTFNNVFLKSQQKQQVMNEFPIDLMDTINYNSAGGINFITFRHDNINSILDLSDNPFIYNVEKQEDAQRVMDRIIDQFWLVYPIDRLNTGPGMDGAEINSAPYNGNIQTFEFDLDDLGVANIIELTNNRKYRIIIPTTISVSAVGVDINAKGQSTYSQKVIGTELSRQVDVIRNAVKETRLLIPDALTTTLNELNEDVDSLESWRTTTNALDAEQNTRLTAVENENQQQNEEWNEFATLVGTDIGTIKRDYLTKSTASSTYATKTDVSNTYETKSYASSTYATKSEVSDANSITSSDNTVSVESGGQTMTLTADAQGYLTISFGGLSWKLKLEQETEGN